MKNIFDKSFNDVCNMSSDILVVHFKDLFLFKENTSPYADHNTNILVCIQIQFSNNFCALEQSARCDFHYFYTRLVLHTKKE